MNFKTTHRIKLADSGCEKEDKGICNDCVQDMSKTGISEFRVAGNTGVLSGFPLPNRHKKSVRKRS